MTIPSNLNAWKTNDKTGGAAPTSYSLSSLPVDIYLESKEADEDLFVKAEMTLNSGVKCRDSIKYTVVKFEIKNPIDSDSDGEIDDDATSSNNYTGNEFTFSSANPGILTLPCRMEVKPNIEIVRNLFNNKIKAEISPIGTSHDPMGPYMTTLTWDNLWSGEQFVGKLVYNSGQQLWVATATFTNLPLNNSDFCQKVADFTIYKTGGGVLFEPKNVEYEVFFPRTATNNPGGTTPNWYYYWKQTSAYIGDVQYDGSSSYGYCAWDTPDYTAYVGTNDHLLYHTPLVGVNADIDIEGIDNFAWTCRHEWRHHINKSNWWGTGGYIAAQDPDGDHIKNSVESGFTASDGGPFNTADQDTFKDDGNLINDHERYTVFTQTHWLIGSANEEDWANPGHQYQ